MQALSGMPRGWEGGGINGDESSIAKNFHGSLDGFEPVAERILQRDPILSPKNRDGQLAILAIDLGRNINHAIMANTEFCNR